MRFEPFLGIIYFVFFLSFLCADVLGVRLCVGETLDEVRELYKYGSQVTSSYQ